MIDTERDPLTERTEILFSVPEKALMQTAARADGRSVSGWVRHLVNMELTRKYPQHHPRGDQADPGEQL